jgi:predicted membrane metal-binding protein
MLALVYSFIFVPGVSNYFLLIPQFIEMIPQKAQKPTDFVVSVDENLE